MPHNAAYRWPAEWEPHESTILTWPQRPDLWSGRIAAVQTAYVDIVRELARGEAVHILVNDAETAAAARALLADLPSRHPVDCWAIPTDDVWVRDYSPLCLLPRSGSGDRRCVSFQFNGWGGKHPAVRDNQAAAAIAERLGDPLHESPDFVLEGGALETNGRGLVITTEACLLHPNRNPGLDRAAIQARIQASLGAREVLWLPCGLAGDDTDGHVDMIARFVAPDHVIACVAREADHPARAGLERNLDVLRKYRSATGEPLTVSTLPLPPLTGDDRTRSPHPIDADNVVPHSYANFYIGNEVVLVPVFGFPEADAEALTILEQLWPNRRVCGIPGADLILEGGGVHCMTMQIPKPAR